MDDDTDCRGHVWLLSPGAPRAAGTHGDYTCRRCGGVLLVPAGGVHPPPPLVQIVWSRREAPPAAA